MYVLLSIGLENGTAECAHYGPPVSTIQRNPTEPGVCLHVRHAGTAAAPGARPRHRLGRLHPPSLIHQETKEYHLNIAATKREGSSLSREMYEVIYISYAAASFLYPAIIK